MKWPKRGVRAANHGSKRFGSVLICQRLQTLRNVVKCFVPAHTLPLVTTTLTHTPQRVIHTVGRIKRLQVHAPAPAPGKRFFAVGVAGRIYLYVNNAAIFHRGKKTAQIAAEVAVRALDFALRHF